MKKPDTTLRLTDSVGKLYGRYGDKNNRVRKLMEDWPDLITKFELMVVRGNGTTETARLAYAVLLMMETGIRVGNEESAEGFVSVGQRVAKADDPAKGVKAGDVIWESKTHGKEVKTYGATTLEGRHVKVRRGKLVLDFVGKKVVDQHLETANPFLVKWCPPAVHCTPWLQIDYSTLYKFVKKYVGRQFKPKDIRAAKVNRYFIKRFVADYAAPFTAPAAKKKDRNKIVSACVEETAGHIGHTPGVCRSAYMSCHLLSVLKNYDPAAHRTVTE